MGKRGPKPGPRLSIAPLDAALARFKIDVEFIEGKLNNSIRQGRARGFVTLDVADEVACKVLKMHPIVIWGEEYVDEVLWGLNVNEEGEALAA